MVFLEAHVSSSRVTVGLLVASPLINAFRSQPVYLARPRHRVWLSVVPLSVRIVVGSKAVIIQKMALTNKGKLKNFVTYATFGHQLFKHFFTR